MRAGLGDRAVTGGGTPATAGRAALVTGGSGGIGLAIARMLAEEGFTLTIAARRPKRLESAAEGLRAAGARVEAVAANVADEEDVRVLIAHHRELHGRLDVLVNSAGTGAVQRIEAVKTRLLDRQLGVNLRAVVLCTSEALPLLLAAGAEHGKALIVNVASLSARRGHAEIPVYAASKAGVVVFTESMRRWAGRRGVGCTVLCPGLVDTPMADYARDRLPGEEMIQPGDLAEAVRFLLRTSPRCLVPAIDLARPGAYPGADV